ncbi:hypothetical protein MXB_3418, partial [Myxobolus squamalis]
MNSKCLILFASIGFSFLLNDKKLLGHELPISLEDEKILQCDSDNRKCVFISSKLSVSIITVKMLTSLSTLTQEIVFKDGQTGDRVILKNDLCPSILNPECSLLAGSRNVLVSTIVPPVILKEV